MDLEAGDQATSSSPMTSGLVTLPATASLKEICAATDRDGAVIVASLFGPATITAVNNELEPYLAALEPDVRYTGEPESPQPYSRRTKRLQSLVARSDTAVRCMLHPTVLEWVTRQLAGHPGDFQLNSAELIEIGPDEPAQPLHADGALLWPAVYGPDLPDTMATCMVAITEFSVANGATRVVPGSHRGDVRSWNAHNQPPTVPAQMTAGSAMLFTGKLGHGGGANSTATESRRGLAITYAAGWLRPEEACCLSVSLERARQLPGRMQELIGFKSYVPTTGGTGNRLWGFDKRDAAEVLTSGPIR